MYLKEVRDILSATVLWGEDKMDLEVHSAFGSDFMSDVLAFVKDQAMLLTGMVNPQVIRTADMMDIKCIVFVRGKVPDETMLELARARDIVVMATQGGMYTSCGLLYINGLTGGKTDE